MINIVYNVFQFQFCHQINILFVILVDYSTVRLNVTFVLL